VETCKNYLNILARPEYGIFKETNMFYLFSSTVLSTTAHILHVMYIYVYILTMNAIRLYVFELTLGLMALSFVNMFPLVNTFFFSSSN